MRTMIALMAAFVATPAFGGEENKTIDVKISVEGMSCPDGCAPQIVKGLNQLENVSAVKLVDFKKGLFALKVNGAKKLSPLALQEAIGTEYALGRIETSLIGTVSKGKRGLVLSTGSGVRYGLVEGKARCESEKACGKTLEQVAGWLKEGKTLVSITGDIDEGCPGKVVLSVRAAKPVEIAKN